VTLSLTGQVFLWVFFAAALLGALVNKTNFCTMGAVSDWVNMGRTNRLRAWVLAMATAIIAVSIIENLQFFSLESTRTPYRTENFAWIRYIIGGLIFGIGMTLASGCANKALIRLGGGNLKSIFVILTAGFFAFLMGKTSLYEVIFQPWVEATTINLNSYSIYEQDLGSFISAFSGIDNLATIRLLSGLFLGLTLLIIIFKSAPFRRDWINIVVGIGVGTAVVSAWYITGGPLGQEWIEAMEWEEEKHIGIAVQGITFIGPMANIISFLMNPSNFLLIGFCMVSLFGVLVGSFLYAILSKSFRIEWFSSWSDFFTHLIGASMMGIGGVLAMGCTIGQGVTGVSTLSLGSFLAVTSIIMGSAITMKIQYYKMVYEDASFFAAIQTVLVDLHLLPNSLRKLDHI
jgi:uncharacterized protein